MFLIRLVRCYTRPYVESNSQFGCLIPKLLETLMNISIQAQGFELTEALRLHTLRRLDPSLHWVREVQQIQIRLSDVNGPKGGPDKRCHIQILMAKKSNVIIEHVDDDLYVAIDRAIARSKHTLSKRLARQRPARAALATALVATT